MHMTSAPHLLTEDRPDFERALDEALRTVLRDHGPDRERALGPDGGDVEESRPASRRTNHSNGHSALNSEQLRTLALGAAELIADAATAEYETYRGVREASREAARESARARDNRSFGYAAMGVAEGAGSGAGLIAVLAVLTPLLAGAAAVIFLLIGYALRAMAPEPAIASPLRTAGWLFAAVTAASILLGAVGLLLTALRDGSSAIHDSPDALPPEVADARDAWYRALLERGMLPFLEDAAAGAALAPTSAHEPPHGPAVSPVPGPATGQDLSRMPRLGYSRPDFSSPAPDPAAPLPPAAPRFSGPRYSSPDFTSPDFGGPDNTPE
ncbi:hypothetical protein ACIOC1_02410 [Streptomyces sp. NPDC088197]|uniref:hypothetical protein n=1 Tax=Streptomyces sp. NPDC088197 TaxID=3365840 RepID=UPI003826900A